jgi:F-type H+-transporting ATPase subunit b
MLRRYFKKTYLFSAIFLMLVSCFVYGPALSEETGHSADQTKTVQAESDKAEAESSSTDRSADLIDLGYRFLTFTLLVVILGFGIKKAKLVDYLSARSDEIRAKLDDLKREKEEAEKKYQEIEAKLNDFESKKKDILEEYRKEGIADKDRIISEAKERANQIINQSEATIKQELFSMRNKVKQEIVDLAIGQAREIIRKEINDKDHDDLINEFIEKVGRIN